MAPTDVATSVRKVPGLTIGSTVLQTGNDWDLDDDSSIALAGSCGTEAPAMHHYSSPYMHQHQPMHQHMQFPTGARTVKEAQMNNNFGHSEVSIGSHVISALGAVKAAVDKAQRPGQVQAVVPLQGMGNGMGNQMLFIWVPEALFTTSSLSKQMPCPHCSSVRDVDNGEWPSDFWFARDQDTFIVAKQYTCHSCAISFRGWHPKTVQALPRNLAEKFPVPVDAFSSSKFAFLYKTVPAETSRPAPFPVPEQLNNLNNGNSLNLGQIDPIQLLRSTSEISLSCESLPNIDIDRFVGAECEDQNELNMWGADDAMFDLSKLEPLPLNRNASLFSLRGGNDPLADLSTSDSADMMSQQQQPILPMHNHNQFNAGHARMNLGGHSDVTSMLPHGSFASTPSMASHASFESDRTPPFSPDSSHMGDTMKEDIFNTSSPDATMAHASMTATRRSIQFCSVCFGVRRQSGQLVAGHRPDGFCPVKKRKATTQEKRELRRRRQKMRRAIKKRKQPINA